MKRIQLMLIAVNIVPINVHYLYDSRLQSRFIMVKISNLFTNSSRSTRRGGGSVPPWEWWPDGTGNLMPQITWTVGLECSIHILNTPLTLLKRVIINSLFGVRIKALTAHRYLVS